jgi:molybdate transport repressor ModE-like protein
MPPNYWRGIELRHLEVLQAIAERGSFWGAADLLDCSPSAVSQQLATLETIVGQRLVERSRGRRQVTITDVGQLLVRHADAIVARLRAAEADLAAFADGAIGTLRVGTYQSVGTKILPRLLHDFAEVWPGIEVQLTEAATDETLLQQIERGELDLTFTILPLPAGSFASVPLMHDPYVLVVPRDSPLVGQDSSPSAEQLGALNLIDFCRCRPVTPVETHLRNWGVEPKIVFRTEDNGIMQALVAAGVGAALAPRLAVDERDTAVQIVMLDGFPRRVLALAWHRDRYQAPAATAFVDHARRICAELEKHAFSVEPSERVEPNTNGRPSDPTA